MFVSWNTDPIANENTVLILSITDTNNTTNITVVLTGANNVFKHTEDTPNPCNIYNFNLFHQNICTCNGCNQSKSIFTSFVIGTM